LDWIERPLGQYGQELTYLRDAETIAESLADQHRLGVVYRRIANTLRQMQDYEPALAYCQRAHAIVTTLGEVDLPFGVRLHEDMGQIYYDLGDYRQAMACFQQTLTALQGKPPDDPFFGVLPLPSVNSRAWMVLYLKELGAFADGVAYGAEALQVAEAVDRPYERLTVYHRVGLLHVRQGTLHQAIPVLERAVVLSQDANIPLFYRLAAPYLALAYALAGRAADTLTVLGQVMRSPDSRRSLACGEAYLLAGCVEEAYRLGQSALAHARYRKMRSQEAQSLWLLGEIALHGNPPDVAPAEAHYQQSLALPEALGMRPLAAHCHLGLGTLYAATGRREPARATLATAISLYRAMDMTFWLPQAEAALAQVGGAYTPDK